MKDDNQLTMSHTIAVFAFFYCCLTIQVFAQAPVRFYQNTKAGFRDATSGQVIVAPQYDAASEFKEGYAIVMLHKKRGLSMKKVF